METMNITPDKYTRLGCHRINKIKLPGSKKGSAGLTKKRRKIRRRKAKQKNAEIEQKKWET